MPNLAPIVLLIHKRPEHTRTLLQSLTANRGVEDTPLYVYCDGPKLPEEIPLVEEARQVVRSFHLPRVTMIERSHNVGIARSLIQGVTEVVDQYGRVIVLEDDFLLSPHFLDYMNRALDRYESHPEVMHVSAYAFPASEPLPETFFIRPVFGACWGWGTWKRAWSHFEPDERKLIRDLVHPLLRHEFNVRGSALFFGRLIAQARGLTDAWDVRWYASIFLQNGLCLRPSLSLLDNKGHDGTGIHCIQTNVFRVTLASSPISQWAERIEESPLALDAAMKFHSALRRDPEFLRNWQQRRRRAKRP